MLYCDNMKKYQMWSLYDKSKRAGEQIISEIEMGGSKERFVNANIRRKKQLVQYQHSMGHFGVEACCQCIQRDGF